MPPFLICIHDATPAFERETRASIRELAPLVGTRLSFGVVPDWHGAWPLAAHPRYCRLLRESADELLLHGYSHRRGRGAGPVSWLAERCDEMNGLDAAETRRTIARGQHVFGDVFGAPAAGFVAPGWQRGHVRGDDAADTALEHVMGFLALESRTGRRVPLATWTWDCGRWRWLGHAGHAIGWMLESAGDRVPTLAIHPRDISRGFGPMILARVRALLERGYEPTTPARLLAC